MSQVSSKLRRAEDGYLHWCPACEEMHILPDSWAFDGNLEIPTFEPSFRHWGIKTVNLNGEWTGEWEFDDAGKPVPFICHYNLIAGKLCFAKDCTHLLANKVVDLPVLPKELRD
jgi:hypothetical protein